MSDEQTEQQPISATPVPALQVQRMGKKWRIVYSETRGLARFNSGKPLDVCEGSETGGGFLDVRDGKTLKVDGRITASKRMAEVLAAQPTPAGPHDWAGDPESEGIGN